MGILLGVYSSSGGSASLSSPVDESGPVAVATLLPRRGIKLLPWRWIGRNPAEGKHLIINLQTNAASGLPSCSRESVPGSQATAAPCLDGEQLAERGCGR